MVTGTTGCSKRQPKVCCVTNAADRSHLGLHAWRGHGMPSRAYREAHGRKARTGTGRLGTEVVCGECGAVFCPLDSARRRLFCTRSCPIATPPQRQQDAHPTGRALTKSSRLQATDRGTTKLRPCGSLRGSR
jgi:hypothetical protein